MTSSEQQHVDAYVNGSDASAKESENLHITVLSQRIWSGSLSIADLIELMGKENHMYLNSTIAR